MTGYRLTQEQADSIRGKQFAPDTFFNPVQDINGDWFIFDSEYELAPRPEYGWFDTLEQVEFIPADVILS